MTTPAPNGRPWRRVARAVAAVAATLARVVGRPTPPPDRPAVSIGDLFAAAQGYDPADVLNDPRWTDLAPSAFGAAPAASPTPTPTTRSVPRVLGYPTGTGPRLG